MSKLILLPNLLGETTHHELFLPASVDKAVSLIDGLIAESETAGRRYLKRFKTKKDPREIPIAILNIHTPDDDIDFLLEPLKQGETWGFVSDAGLPCIADPGSKIVFRARQLGIKVQAFVGPCSFILALMLSGLSGQSFHFHGYLSKDPSKRREEILKMEKAAGHTTQIFMEAPFRNQHTLESAVAALQDETFLCVAWDLTLPTQGILTQKISHWKKSPLPNLEGKAAVFVIGA